MKEYYNRRVGQGGERPVLTLIEVSRQIAAGYDYLERQGYLQRSFGYYCVDEDRVAGLHGGDIRTCFYLNTGIRIDKAISDFITDANEVVLFTLVEFLHDHVAKPDERTGRYHSFSNCGWHFNCRSGEFDVEGAQQEWRDVVNGFLKYYGDGFELSQSGDVTRVAPDGLAPFFETAVLAAAGDRNVAKLNNAVRTFRRGRSSREEQKQAVRDLVDLLEFYRPQVKEHLLANDEADLFKIANNYAIRHYQSDQKDDYNASWLTWLFYLYLSTVHLVLSLVHGQPDEVVEDADEEIPF